MADENGNGDNDGDENDERTPLQERLHRLQGLVMQHALPHVRAEVRKHIAELHLVPERVDLIVDEMRQEIEAQGATPEEVEEAVAVGRENLLQMGRGEPGPVEEIVGMVLLEVAPKVVVAWVNVLGTYASRRDGLAWLRLSTLGPDMLPLGDKECDQEFDEEFNQDSPIDGAAARAILRDIRASLPAGKTLPEDMIQALDLAWSIMVVP